MSRHILPSADYDTICEKLSELEAEAILEFETCEERVPGSFDDLPEVEPENEI